MMYTINGKQYSEFDINKRCAELMRLFITETIICLQVNYEAYNPCNNPSDTWPIIEKCWDELMEISVISHTAYWDYLEKRHKCTKLVAACICFIESNDA